MVEVTDIFLGIAVGLGSLNAILNVIVIRNFPVVRDIRHILKQLGGVLGLESMQQNIVPTTNIQPQPQPPQTVAGILAGMQNQSPPDPIRETQEATIKFLQKDNRSLRNKMNRIFKKNEIDNLEPEEEEQEEEGNEGDAVTSENLDIEIVKKFGAKIPQLNGINLNDPVAKQTVAGMINGNAQYRKLYNAAKILKTIIPDQAEQQTTIDDMNRVCIMKSVTVTVDDSTVTIWQNLILEQKRLGEISRKTTTNKRMFRAFVQEYIDLKLKRELLERLEITRKVKFTR